MNRRKALEYLACCATGIGIGLWINIFFGGKKNNPGSFEPLFRIRIFSEEFLRENYDSKKISEIKEMCGGTNGYTELAYLHPTFSNVDIYRKGGLIHEGFKQTNNYRFILAREIGTIPYTFVLNKGKRSSEELKIKMDFKTDYELESYVTDNEEEETGPKVEFLNFQGKFPRRARVMGENKVVYDIHGIEAVCRGVSKDLLQEYFENIEKYSGNKNYRKSGFDRFKEVKGIR